MQNNFQNTIFKRAMMIVSFCSFFSTAYAQYPDIPKPLQDKTDAVMKAESERLDQIWKANEHIIKAEALLGRPYVPWASLPTDLVHADIPAFPGAVGGGAQTPG